MLAEEVTLEAQKLVREKNAELESAGFSSVAVSSASKPAAAAAAARPAAAAALLDFENDEHSPEPL